MFLDQVLRTKSNRALNPLVEDSWVPVARAGGWMPVVFVKPWNVLSTERVNEFRHEIAMIRFQIGRIVGDEAWLSAGRVTRGEWA